MPDRGEQRVVAAVMMRDNRYLVAQRPLHKHHGGLWEFPGGKMVPGETTAAALARELMEELALPMLECGPSLHCEHDSASGLLIEFMVATVVGEPQRLEHCALAWCSLEELAQLQLAPADARFVEKLRRLEQP